MASGSTTATDGASAALDALSSEASAAVSGWSSLKSKLFSSSSRVESPGASGGGSLPDPLHADSINYSGPRVGSCLR